MKFHHIYVDRAVLVAMLAEMFVQIELFVYQKFWCLGSFGRAYIGTLINAESGEDMKVLVKTVTGNWILLISRFVTICDVGALHVDW